MTPSEPELEKLLRQAPHPQPPPGLRQDLLRAAPTGQSSGPSSTAPGLLLGWLSSWRLALATACLALAALGVATAQQIELRDLRQQVEQLRQQLEARTPAPPSPAAAQDPAPDQPAQVAPPSDRDELERLRAEVAQLEPAIASLPALNAENAALRRELDQLTSQSLGADLAALREAREKAQRIQCVNNLKQLGLAVRIYANDHQEVTPPDVPAMANEVSTPKILVCPADTQRQAAASWSAFTPANLSYEYLAPDTPGFEPTRVMFRCLVHRGSVCLGDGSVQQLSEAMQAQRLVTRDGKLYLDAIPQPAGRQGGR